MVKPIVFNGILDGLLVRCPLIVVVAPEAVFVFVPPPIVVVAPVAVVVFAPASTVVVAVLPIVESLAAVVVSTVVP